MEVWVDQGSRPQAARQENTFAFTTVRKPATANDFEPSWHLSKTAAPRSVSAFGLAFLSAEVTKQQLRSKPATPRRRLCAP